MAASSQLQPHLPTQYAECKQPQRDSHLAKASKYGDEGSEKDLQQEEVGALLGRLAGVEKGSCRQEGEVADLQAPVEGHETRAAAAHLLADRKGGQACGRHNMGCMLQAERFGLQEEAMSTNRHEMGCGDVAAEHFKI